MGRGAKGRYPVGENDVLAEMFPHVSCLGFLVNVVLWANVPVPVADLSLYDSVREPTQDLFSDNRQMVYRQPNRCGSV